MTRSVCPSSTDGNWLCFIRFKHLDYTFPFISQAASSASAGLSNVTNAKPRDLFVSRSFIKSTKMRHCVKTIVSFPKIFKRINFNTANMPSTILPYLLKYCSKASSLVSVFSPPINNLPGRSASAIFAEMNIKVNAPRPKIFINI